MNKPAPMKHYTRGGQTSFHNLRMWDQITKTLVFISLSLWIILTVFFALLVIPFEKFEQMIAYYTAVFFDQVGFKHTFTLTFHGKAYQQPVDMLLHYPYYAANAKHIMRLGGQSALFALGAALLIGLSLAYYFIKKGKAQSANQFVRGSKLERADNVKRLIHKAKQASDICIDGFPLLADSEVQHLLVHGTVGTGKSQLIMKILDRLRERGDRVIVYDKGCAFIPHYWRQEQDVILNPFDARCPNWNLWQEAMSESDFDNIAESLIPLQGDVDPFWVNAARTLFVQVATIMHHEPSPTTARLLQLLLVEDFSTLTHYLQGTPAATLVSDKIEKTALSIRATLSTALKSLQTLTGLETKPPFSIRNYLLDEQNSGWLFISSTGEHHARLTPLISMWLAQASLALLSLTPDRNRRIWFVCDELPSLYKLPRLGETIAEIRKFGGCFLLGMQSYAQLTKIYGQAGAKELFDLLNTRFFFRSPSSDMARLVASELGEEDLDEAKEQYSYGANTVRDGISLSNQRVTRPLVFYPQILNLDNLNCFVRLAGNYPITQLTLKHLNRPVVASGFVVQPQPSTLLTTASSITEDAPSSSPIIPELIPPARKAVSLTHYLD